MAVESVDALTTRALHTVHVELAEPAGNDGFMGLEGVRRVEMGDGDRVLTFEVAGDLDPLIKALAAHHVVSLEAQRPTLEDAFLEYYGSEADAEAEHA